LNSKPIEKEIDLAIYQDKKIIPLFQNIKYIRAILKPITGIKFQGHNFEKTIDDLLNAIIAPELSLKNQKSIKKPEEAQNFILPKGVIIDLTTNKRSSSLSIDRTSDFSIMYKNSLINFRISSENGIKYDEPLRNIKFIDILSQMQVDSNAEAIADSTTFLRFMKGVLGYKPACVHFDYDLRDLDDWDQLKQQDHINIRVSLAHKGAWGWVDKTWFPSIMSQRMCVLNDDKNWVKNTFSFTIIPEMPDQLRFQIWFYSNANAQWQYIAKLKVEVL